MGLFRRNKRYCEDKYIEEVMFISPGTQFIVESFDSYREYAPGSIFELASLIYTIDKKNYQFIEMEYGINILKGQFDGDKYSTDDCRSLKYQYPEGNFIVCNDFFNIASQLPENEKIYLEPWTEADTQRAWARAIDQGINKRLDSGEIKMSHLSKDGEIVYEVNKNNSEN